MRSFVPKELEEILLQTPILRRSFLVGGCVRDALLDLAAKDFDIEVFHAAPDELAAALKRWGRVEVVGRAFGVFKLATPTGAQYDFSLPRRDSKVAPGHLGFAVHFDPAITPAEAAARRDFTINALMFDPRSREVLDFWNGQEDLKHRVLRHTSSAFTEDPLRVLRGMQLAGRFGLKAASETIAACREIKAAFAELPVERVREEWFKWAARSSVPSAGLKFIEAAEWIDHFPEIRALRETPQDPVWHPEGDVFSHVCHCCDALARLPQWQQADETSRVVLMLAVLAHDFGKPLTTQRTARQGAERIMSPGHAEAGVAVTESFLDRIQAPVAVRERVLPLVLHHMAHLAQMSDRYVRRLANRLAPETIESLCLVITADAAGRPPKPADLPASVTALIEGARRLKVEAAAPRPILMGRHLMELGMVPGPEFGQILDAAFEAQLEGEFHDLAGSWRWLATKASPALTPEARQRLERFL